MGGQGGQLSNDKAMRQKERADIVRIVSGLVGADAVIGMKKLKVVVSMKEKYGIWKADEVSSSACTLAKAIQNLQNADATLCRSLLADFDKMVMADNSCTLEGALLALALRCCLAGGTARPGHVVSVNATDAFMANPQILYVENQYQSAVNGCIRTHYREIVSEVRLCGFDFVYLPKVIEHYNSVSRETLYQMVSLLYPHIDDSRLTAMPHWLDTMSTARFCEELFASKLRIKAISGVAPSLLVRMGHSAVSGKTYANYLLLELVDDVRNTVRFVSDILTAYCHPVRLAYACSERDPFVFSGFCKQLLDLYLLRRGVRSTVVVDALRNEIRFPEAAVALKILHRREKALYVLFLLESARGGIDFNKPGSAAQVAGYERRMSTLQAKYRMIYRMFGGDPKKAPNIASPDIRLPMISLIRRQIGEFRDVLAYADDYTVRRDSSGSYSIGLPSALCYSCGTDPSDVRPLSDADDWARIAAL